MLQKLVDIYWGSHPEKSVVNFVNQGQELEILFGKKIEALWKQNCLVVTLSPLNEYFVEQLEAALRVFDLYSTWVNSYAPAFDPLTKKV